MPEYLYLDDSAITIQKKLNQWKHTYFLVLHNPRYYAEVNVGSGGKDQRISMMLERTPKETTDGS